ncbi:hypothetical protein AN639_09910 [Candidatus Epulonipiscium fishelsonii]|uniref:Uncharacterized protein n=1 Tax=Candidatus Epulonipiscium fishelsonii TaxID=77094 RepID=A0ACC8XFU5_9FIRM|nr:hypothetical protein AN396_01645 [Epulopiscium sp. SCG-B11WGA-EpuloA1]ONI43820.1 hypothetical protein AN639_09910 [Epulopiscium sp. SCG-B05WGA-EpuloA1]
MKQLLHIYNIKSNKKIFIRFLSSMMVIFGLPFYTLASGITDTYYIGKAVNSGDGDGYSEVNLINSEDPHYGWDIGKFYVDGFSEIKSESGNPAFITSGKVALNFTLKQDIDTLGGKENLSVAEDKKGYHEYFNIRGANFGRGTLIIQYTSPKGVISTPIVYTDYLTTIDTNKTDKVAYLNEGKYDVSFNYRVKDDSNLLGLFPLYNDYSINFKFYVTNEENMDELEDISKMSDGDSSGGSESVQSIGKTSSKVSSPASSSKSSSSKSSYVGGGNNNSGQLTSVLPFLVISISLIFLLFRDKK